MFKSKINYLLLIIVFVAVGVYLNNSIESVFNDISNASIVNKIITKEIEVLKEVEAPAKINAEYNDPLLEAGCIDGGSIYYWDFTNDTDDFRHPPLERLSGYEKGNFYIFCNGIKDNGEAVLFKNNKPIFKTGLIYKGYMFMDYDNYFNVVEGIHGEANYCPKSYILKRYKYNPEIELMDLVETKEYLTEEITTEEGWITCISKELDEFIDNNFIN